MKSTRRWQVAHVDDTDNNARPWYEVQSISAVSRKNAKPTTNENNYIQAGSSIKPQIPSESNVQCPRRF